MTVGQRIKQARERRNMTQAELAKKLDISYQAVSQYERDLRNPKLQTLRRIASILDVTVGYLEGYEDINAGKVLRALKQKNNKEIERLLGLPEGSIGFISDEEEADINAKYDMRKKETQQNIAKLKLIVRIAYDYFSEKDFAVLKSVIEGLSKLNDKGQKVAVERVEELTKIPDYRKEKEDNEGVVLVAARGGGVKVATPKQRRDAELAFASFAKEEKEKKNKK